MTLKSLTLIPATAAVLLLSGCLPEGAIVAFDSEECPTGWEEYAPAYGRFIRGIDKTGVIDPEGQRESGHVQQSEIGKHTHPYWDIYFSEILGQADLSSVGNRGHEGPQDSDNDGFQIKRDADIVGGENRQVNVALLYCSNK